MANLALLDKVLVTFRGTLLEQRVANTFKYVVIEAPGVLVEQVTAFNALYSAMDAVNKLIQDFLVNCPDNYALNEVWFQVVSPTRFAAIKIFADQGGNSGADALTANLAAVVTRRGELANRRNISSLHVPAPTDILFINNGNLTASYQSSMLLLANELTVEYTASGYKFSPSIWGESITDPVPITQAELQPTARVMRRRTLRVGE